ncbi:methyltransferase [Nocardia salmonicida]|uniref:methyltransferase n=1 Tax=Nocardia salmonicida TaxID=53431 RepID=UPI003CFA408A
MHNAAVDVPETAESLPLIVGFAISQIAGTTARLGVPDLLADSSRTLDELVTATAADRECLRRLLRAAEAAGLLTISDGRYELTRVGRLFCSDSPRNARLGDAISSHPAVWRAWGALEDTVRTGRPSFELVNGVDMFEYMHTDSTLASSFHKTMATRTAVQMPAILEHFDFGRFSHIVDCGGGNGTFVSEILAANKGVRGTVFDSPGAVEQAQTVLARAGVTDRCDVVTGDFFTSVPPGADVYLLKSVINDWDDESCRKILRNCRDAMAEHGRIVVFTSTMPERGTVDPAAAMAVAIQDVATMVMRPGSIRTIAEYETLLASAGFKLAEVTPLHCPFFFHALEAVPI